MQRTPKKKYLKPKVTVKTISVSLFTSNSLDPNSEDLLLARLFCYSCLGPGCNIC